MYFLDDPFGKPYGPEKSCCCNQVYKKSTHFCCQLTPDCSPNSSLVLQNTVENQKFCEFQKTLKCPKLDLPNVEQKCSAADLYGSTCEFSCPESKILHGTKSLTCDDIFQDWKSDQDFTLSSGLVDKPCCESVCLPAPKDHKIDFFMIIDSSSSIGVKNFNLMKDFIIAVIKMSNLNSNGVRVGLMTFHKEPTIRFHLNTFENPESCIEFVQAIEYAGKGTKTGAAVEIANSHAFHDNFGNRDEAANKVLLITDGRSQDAGLLREEVKILKTKAEVYALGIGDKVDEKEINMIASEPKSQHVLMVEDFFFLKRSLATKGTIEDILCPKECTRKAL